MKIESDHILESIFASLDKLEYIKSAEIPDIDLYMDQVLTFMNGKLEWSKRYEDDKIMTKTMINNYAKNDLLPPPVKKKYSKEHLLSLIFIYYLKNILSISDIHTVLAPITEKYFGNKEGRNLEDIYSVIFQMEKEESTKILKEYSKKYNIAKHTFCNIFHTSD